MPLFTHLLAIATVAIVGLSSLPANANALAADHARAARHIHVHDAVAKRRRDTSSSTTCKPRPSSSPPSSTPTPTPTPTLTPTSSPSATPSSSSSKKMCLAWGTSNDYLKNFALDRVGYFQNWDFVIPRDQLEQLGITPMLTLWGNKQGMAEQFQEAAVAGYAHHAGGPNEPNEPSQANMNPEDAANFWYQYLDPLKDLGYTLYGPCCTDSPDAKTWYQEFYASCAKLGCRIDWSCVHLYNTDVNYIFDYLSWLYDTFHYPVLVTEVADQDFTGANMQASLDQIDTFAEAIVNFTYTNDWMVAVCPFGVMSDLQGVNTLNLLLDSTTNGPTDLAHKYFGY